MAQATDLYLDAVNIFVRVLEWYGNTYARQEEQQQQREDEEEQQQHNRNTR